VLADRAGERHAPNVLAVGFATHDREDAAEIGGRKPLEIASLDAWASIAMNRVVGQSD